MAFPRQVISVPGQGRVNSPVPEGLRVGDWLFCSLLGPTYTNRPPGKDALDDARIMFERIGDLLKHAGGSLDNLAHLIVYVMDDDFRKDINVAWEETFPDPTQRPARCILNVAPNGTHWRFSSQMTAILGDNLGKPVYSPMITGKVPGTGEIPSDRLRETEVMFDNLKTWSKSAGGSLANVAQVMVYLMEDDRNTLNKSWAQTFPDITDLPCRQTLLVDPNGLQEGNFAAFATAIL